MIKIHNKIKLIFLYLVLCVALVACSKEKKEENGNIVTDATTQELQSPQDYRAAIDGLGTQKEDLELKLEYYNVLWQLDAFDEKDFDDLSQVYNQLGDMGGMRDTLIRKHIYYPSEENVELINDIILVKDSSSEELSGLMDMTVECLNDMTNDNVKTYVTSSTWKELMQDDLVGVTRKTKYTGVDYVAQIATDVNSTTIFLYQDNTVIYYRLSQAGVVWGTAKWENNNYCGEYNISYFDETGSLVKKCRGNFENGVTTGKFEMELDGNIYTGEFDEDGRVTSEQIQEVTSQGGVVYAYSQSEDTYLYVEDTDTESFVIDHIYLGLPLYKPW